eukprot:gene6585-7275_t
MDSPSISRLALFTFLLPSLMRTLDCGFRYEYVLGYDAGDAYYDSVKGLEEVKVWFSEQVEKPLARRGVLLQLRLVRVNNTIKKPGPVFLAMARAAYEAGASYFFRVNDDTELLSKWPRAFVQTIQRFSPPVAVVGPFCAQGNSRILTHDFVHRTHMDIFGMNYYPPQLTDWWMDDWISFVYGQWRSFKAKDIVVVHHTGAHGQRYQVDSSHEALLGSLVKKGRQQIRQYLLRIGANASELRAVEGSAEAQQLLGFPLRDIPFDVKSQL